MSHDIDSRYFDPADYQVAARMGGIKPINKKVSCPEYTQEDIKAKLQVLDSEFNPKGNIWSCPLK